MEILTTMTKVMNEADNSLSKIGEFTEDQVNLAIEKKFPKKFGGMKKSSMFAAHKVDGLNHHAGQAVNCSFYRAIFFIAKKYRRLPLRKFFCPCGETSTLCSVNGSRFFAATIINF